MIKKITTVISSKHKVIARKAVVMGGVILGIGIGLLLNKVEDPDVIIEEKLVEDDEVERFFENDDVTINGEVKE
jgi:hypothetical protein